MLQEIVLIIMSELLVLLIREIDEVIRRHEQLNELPAATYGCIRFITAVLFDG